MTTYTKIILVSLILLAFARQASAAAPTIGDVFYIAMENHNFQQKERVREARQILDNHAAPFQNSLVTPANPNAVFVSYATNYTSVCHNAHPSEANYIWAEAGTNFNPEAQFAIHYDNDPSADSRNIFNVPHITGLMDAAAISWKNYQEDVEISGQGPTVSAKGRYPNGGTNAYNGSTRFGYAAKHNPFCFFADTQTKNTFPISQLAADLNSKTVGQYNWITPDLYNDSHTPLPDGYTYHGVHYYNDQAAVAEGDNFLSIVIPQIEASPAFKNNGLIVIWYDETEGGDTAAFTMPEIVISPLAKGNAYNSTIPMNHSSDVKTLQEIFGLGPYYLNNDIPTDEFNVDGPGHFNTVTSVHDLSDLFKPGVIPNKLP